MIIDESSIGDGAVEDLEMRLHVFARMAVVSIGIIGMIVFLCLTVITFDRDQEHARLFEGAHFVQTNTTCASSREPSFEGPPPEVVATTCVHAQAWQTNGGEFLWLLVPLDEYPYRERLFPAPPSRSEWVHQAPNGTVLARIQADRSPVALAWYHGAMGPRGMYAAWRETQVARGAAYTYTENRW